MTTASALSGKCDGAPITNTREGAGALGPRSPGSCGSQFPYLDSGFFLTPERLMTKRFVLSLAALLGLAPGQLAAQEAFEIEVYPYATAARGEWGLETHLNYAPLGTTVFDGTV